MRTKSFRKTLQGAVAAGMLAAGLPSVAQAQIAPITTQPIFSDDFSGSKLDSSQWSVIDGNQSHGSAQFGNTPTTERDSDGTTYLKVPLQTYNPKQPGKAFLGTELFSRQNWDLGTGKEYEARLRMKDLPAGLCLGFFAYGSSGVWQDTYLQSEIDYEFLTQQAGNQVWLNIWDDWNPLRGGPRGDGGGFSPLQTVPNLNWKDGAWHNFKIRWYPDHTEWVIDDRWVHTEDRIQPGSPLGVRFTHWAGDGSWGLAYSPSLTPASNASANRVYSLDVDYIKVRSIPAPSKGVWGNGTGLEATYFNNADLTGTKVTRTDPRINFDWGQVAPDSRIDANSWSARWTGTIQPQYNERYTLYVRSDDGARIYLNNTKVVDDWKDRSSSDGDSIYSFNATAGQKIPITIEYFDNSGNASCKFYWSSPSTEFQLVPQSQLYAANTAPVDVAAPAFSPPAGTYTSSQQVAITSNTPGATIYYTTNGNDPTTDSASLPAGAKVLVSNTLQLKAIAVVPNQGSSAVSSASYIISISNADATPPVVTITAPRNGAKVQNFSGIKGTLVDNTGGSGPDHVDVQIRRVSDGAVWNGWTWTNTDTAIPTKIKGTKWNVTKTASNGATLPAAAMLKNQSFVIRAIGYDKAGNAADVAISVTGPVQKPKKTKGKATGSIDNS